MRALFGLVGVAALPTIEMKTRQVEVPAVKIDKLADDKRSPNN